MRALCSKKTHCQEDKISSKSFPLKNKFGGKGARALEISYSFLDLKVSNSKSALLVGCDLGLVLRRHLNLDS